MCHGQFVNMSCCSPNMFIVPDQGFKILNLAGSRRMALSVMCGAVTECSLVSSALQGTKSVHRLVVRPLAQQYTQDVVVWGASFWFSTCTASISAGGISFSSAPEKTDDNDDSADRRSPSKTQQSYSGMFSL